MEPIVIGILVLLFGALIISGKLRVIVKGCIGLFVEDLAKTPKGAESIYNQAIEKAQNQYNIANDTLQKVAGQLDSAEKALVIAQERLKRSEERCEVLAKNKKFDELETYSIERTEALEEVDIQQKMVERLKPVFIESKMINTKREEILKELQKDKTRKINELKMNEQMKSLYDNLDELKNTDNVDKLLDTVNSAVKDGREQAVGAKIVHENKTSTQLERAETAAKKVKNDDYVEQLKKRYGGQEQSK